MATPFGLRPAAQPELGWAKRRGVVRFGTEFLIGASGAITSQDKSEFTGMSQVVKTAAQVGRYTFTLPCTFKTLRSMIVTLVGPNSANYGANTTGLLNFARANDIESSTGNKDGTIELQFVQGTYADAEVPSGVLVYVEISVETGV